MRQRISATCLLIAAALLPPAARAATLRPLTTLHAPVVLLSDLFDDAGPLAARVLGPAPGPGGRIVVEARQLAAIARMFGVAWHPTSPGDAAVLERPGRALPREAVLAALRRRWRGRARRRPISTSRCRASRRRWSRPRRSPRSASSSSTTTPRTAGLPPSCW